jgi:DNA repair exonuclease SbcCD ATPase subunit
MKIYIQNFRCFKEKIIEFPQGNISLLKGESGKGKTTILQSFFWCLFGSLRNIYPLDFKPSSSNQTIVTLEFPNSNLRYITRSQPPEQIKVYIKKENNLSLSKENSESKEEFDVLESEAAQRYIESVFGAKDIWFVSSYLAQGERSPLMTNSNSDKMNLLCEILFGNKFNSEVENYQNPDWYSSKIEQELNEVSSKLTFQTNLYNTNYAKYMEAHNNYSPSSNKNLVWSTVPSESDLESIVLEIYNMKNSISEITKKMLSLKGLEKEKEFLEQRVSELNIKIKAFESMNSDDAVKYLQKTREEIKDLESNIQDLNTHYLSTLAKEQKKEFLQSKLTQEEEKLRDLKESNLFDRSITLKEINVEINSKKEKISKLREEIMEIQLKENEKDTLIQKSSKLTNELTDVISKLSNFPIKDIDYLRKLIQNTLSFQKLKDIQDREPEKVDSKVSSLDENDLLNFQLVLPKFINEYKLNQKLCSKHNLITSENEEITVLIETKIKNNHEKIKKVLDFVDIMKKELELKKKHDVLDGKITIINETLETLKDALLKDEKKLEEYKIQTTGQSLTLETYISMKTEIQMNTGDSMTCPDCNSSLEINHTSSDGMKLCKLTKVRYSKENSKKYIEIINRLSENVKIFRSKESELTFLNEQKSYLQDFNPEYTSEQVINKYTPELISKYKTYYEDFLTYKFNLSNEYNLSYQESCETLESIPKIRQRRTWEKEFEQAKTNLSIDSSLPLLDKNTIKLYESNIVEIPILQSKHASLESNKTEVYESLTAVKLFLETKESLTSLKENLDQLRSDIEDLSKQEKHKILYEEINENINKLKSELKDIDKSILTPSEEIKNKITQLKHKTNALKETLSGYSQFEVLSEELTTNESKLNENKNSINTLSLMSSEQLSKQLEEINQTIIEKEAYHKSGKDLREMYVIRETLEKTQKEALMLATDQSHLNRLKILITEVTNSSLQNLVDSINSCTNSILEDLFENDIKVELKLFKEHKKTNSLKPQVNFTIYYNNNIYDNIMGLSGGEKDRISLALTVALACVNPSPVLFLDECLSTVGNDLRECAIEALKKYIIAQTGKTCILVQHSMIEGHCDSVIEI